jgi:hypothetical protein
LEAAEHEAERQRECAEQRQQVAEAMGQRELSALRREWERDPDKLLGRLRELIVSRLDAVQVAAQAEQQQTAA